MIQTNNAMREAFAHATSNVEKKDRTAVYAQVRSALNRKVGQSNRKTMWSVERRGK